VAPSYDHRQRAAWVFVLITVVAGVLAATLLAGERPSWLPWVLGLVLVLMLGVAFVFSSLRVEVGDGRVRASFGPGWPRWERAVSEIASWQPVRNRWWYGFGIRLAPGGWMFNVSGLDAVELTLASGRKFRIGTDEPAALVAALDAERARR
jgi:hypothetical protein